MSINHIIILLAMITTMPITALWGNINIPSIEKKSDFGIELKTIEEKESDRVAAQTARVEKKVTKVARVRKQNKKVTEVAKSSHVGNVRGVEQWRPLCVKYFGSKANECLAIMKAESGGEPTRVSPSDDHGLMQINCSFVGSKGAGGWCTWFGVTRKELKQAELNVSLAKKIYDRSGKSWYQWTTARKLGLR